MSDIFSPELRRAAEILLQSCRARGLTIACAESCTGGLIGALLTEIPGSSDVFTHGFITYANAAKTDMLGVSAALLREHGAVSEAVARAMAEGAIKNSGGGVSIAVTGIAGPGGATVNKPVGLVHIAAARSRFSTLHRAANFTGDRTTVRLSAVQAALELMQMQLMR